MKFIPGEGAPDIPPALQFAHENKEVVFFCGAGISCNLGLPTFEKLVEDVYKALTNKSLSEGPELSPDQTLHWLETQYERQEVREKLIKFLTIEDLDQTEVHEAILELSKIDGAHRLVTTNADRGFIVAGAEKDKVDTAPKLPVPKPLKWRSIVHLHGLIDPDNELSSESLVFTSGDFGAAYLTEGWAARFLVDLFRYFHVVFIGYSLKDRVLPVSKYPAKKN